MAAPHIRNAGAYVKPVHALSPAASSAATRNSAAIDRLGFESAVLVVQSGATSGTPTTQTLDAKLQDSADGSTGWADYSPPQGSAAVTQVTAADTTARVNVDLSGAKRYVRVAQTVAFTGGTSPTLLNNAALVLAGPVGPNALPTT
jgi:hypothetical protein